MKRVVLLAAIAAVVAPAAAFAGRHGPKPRPPVHATTQNAAWACKALRAQDAAAFAKAFGTNRTLRNAYGKCVSAHARSARLRHATITLHDVTVTSNGTVTDAGAAGCQTTDAGCTLTSSGTLNGIAGGTYTSAWTIRWKQAASNGAGGYCAPATGTTTLALPVLGTITKSEQGTVCEVGRTGANVEHTLKNGTFGVTASSGRIATATGSGTVAFDQKPGTSSALGGRVLGSEHFDELTLTF